MNKLHNLKNVKLKTYKLKSKNNEIIELLKFHSHKDKKKCYNYIHNYEVNDSEFNINDYID